MSDVLLRIAFSSALATLAAAAAERALREAGQRPGRWPSAGALPVTTLITVLLLAGGSLPLRAPHGISLVAAEAAAGFRLADAPVGDGPAPRALIGS